MLKWGEPSAENLSWDRDTFLVADSPCGNTYQLRRIGSPPDTDAWLMNTEGVSIKSIHPGWLTLDESKALCEKDAGFGDVDPHRHDRAAGSLQFLR